MKKIIYLIMVAALLCGCTKKEGESEDGGEDSISGLHGTVVISGEPVNAAAILLTPGGGIKITGSDGMYEFGDLQPGKYELKVFKEGFQSFNSSIDISQGEDKEVTVTLTRSAGNLSINKAYVDMGSNEGNNIAGFSILNAGDAEIEWSVSNAARWITNIDPPSGSVMANSATAVVFTIDRSKLSSNTTDNYATLVARSTTTGDGSTAELLITVFGSGDGTNTTIGSDEEYIIVGDLYVQTKDLGGEMDWASAYSSCENSTVGGFDDWCLPNRSELGTLYVKKEAIGGFVTTSGGSGYWSSESYNHIFYYGMNFYNGSIGYSNGQERCRCVRKSSPLPVVATLPVSNISATAATLNGKIEKKGEPAYTERGFVYSGIFQNPGIDDDDSQKKVVPGTSMEFVANVSGLTTNVTYYVRAYATNSNGTVYGESVGFTPGVSQDVVILQGSNLMVMKQDMGSAGYSTANSLCANATLAGYSDWRLPTSSELAILYTNKVTIGGFQDSYYWSSTSCNSNYNSYHTQISFSSGNSYCEYDGYAARVRAVRTLQ